jgi:hypothetical protein
MIPASIYPKVRDNMQKILHCGNSLESVAEAIGKWNGYQDNSCTIINQ